MCRWVKGIFDEAIGSVFPNTEVQGCIVHQVRYSTKFVPWKDRKQFCADMREIYTALNEQAGLDSLNSFEQKWGTKYPYATFICDISSFRIDSDSSDNSYVEDVM